MAQALQKHAHLSRFAQRQLPHATYALHDIYLVLAGSLLFIYYVIINMGNFEHVMATMIPDRYAGSILAPFPIAALCIPPEICLTRQALGHYYCMRRLAPVAYALPPQYQTLNERIHGRWRTTMPTAKKGLQNSKHEGHHVGRRTVTQPQDSLVFKVGNCLLHLALLGIAAGEYLA